MFRMLQLLSTKDSEMRILITKAQLKPTVELHTPHATMQESD
uniref:Uncharacterized protein n=1 Tax=Arundo donax TaxID=35708 RepID=A0A0A9F4I6_ARUDO